MDKVRFGRALGVGAREAAKALVKAADAATSPDPNATRTAGAPAVELAERRTPETVRTQLVEKAEQARATGAGVKRGTKKFGEAVWGPFAKISGVLWLEVTGVLFGMVAAVAGIEAWQDRHALRAGGAAQQHAWFAVGMFVLFAYFCVTSYTRAAKRGRR